MSRRFFSEVSISKIISTKLLSFIFFYFTINIFNTYSNLFFFFKSHLIAPRQFQVKNCIGVKLGKVKNNLTMSVLMLPLMMPPSAVFFSSYFLDWHNLLSVTIDNFVQFLPPLNRLKHNNKKKRIIFLSL